MSAMSRSARARKLAAAERHLRDAERLLSDVCEEFKAHGYAMPEAERRAWPPIARAADSAAIAAELMQATRELLQLTARGANR